MPGTRSEHLGDEVLLEGFAEGDTALAEEFVRRFQAPVFGMAVTVLGDRYAAEDVAQRCFEQAWRHAGGYDARREDIPLGTAKTRIRAALGKLHRALSDEVPS